MIATQLSFLGDNRTVCCCCGRQLTNPHSVENGIGPICGRHKGEGMQKQRENFAPNYDLFPPADLDRTLEYTPANGIKARCRIRIYYKREHSCNVVVFSEMVGNPGTSITNAGVELVRSALEQFGLNRLDTIFLEHYPNAYFQSGAQTYKTNEETLDMMSFEWDGQTPSHPHWTSIFWRQTNGDMKWNPALDEPNSPLTWLVEGWRS